VEKIGDSPGFQIPGIRKTKGSVSLGSWSPEDRKGSGSSKRRTRGSDPGIGEIPERSISAFRLPGMREVRV
jgi:hypothetical protein